MRHIYFYLIQLIFTGVVFYSGCDANPTSVEIDSRPMPETNVSFRSDLQPFIEIKCATAGCHDTEQRAGGLSLSSWASTTSDFTIVTPFEPDQSRLVWTIDPKFGSPNPMPPMDAPVIPLTVNQIRGIRTWIAEGAKDN